MTIKMTPEEFANDGHELLSAKGWRELENIDACLFYAIGDGTWLDDEMGETDNGPFCGQWWGMIRDKENRLFVVLRISDWSRDVRFFDTDAELMRFWEDVQMEAYLIAAENCDLEYFDLTNEEFAEIYSEYYAQRGLRIIDCSFENPREVARLLCNTLQLMDPVGFDQWEHCSPFGIIPSHAQEDLDAEWWSTHWQGVKAQLVDSITACCSSNIVFQYCVDNAYRFVNVNEKGEF